MSEEEQESGFNECVYHFRLNSIIIHNVRARSNERKDSESGKERGTAQVMMYESRCELFN